MMKATSNATNWVCNVCCVTRNRHWLLWLTSKQCQFPRQCNSHSSVTTSVVRLNYWNENGKLDVAYTFAICSTMRIIRFKFILCVVLNIAGTISIHGSTHDRQNPSVRLQPSMLSAALVSTFKPRVVTTCLNQFWVLQCTYQESTLRSIHCDFICHGQSSWDNLLHDLFVHIVECFLSGSHVLLCIFEINSQWSIIRLKLQLYGQAYVTVFGLEIQDITQRSFQIITLHVRILWKRVRFGASWFKTCIQT